MCVMDHGHFNKGKQSPTPQHFNYRPCQDFTERTHATTHKLKSVLTHLAAHVQGCLNGASLNTHVSLSHPHSDSVKSCNILELKHQDASKCVHIHDWHTRLRSCKARPQ